MKKKDLPKHSFTWILTIIILGFGLMLFTSLIAYKVEGRYLKAVQNYTLTQQGRIDQLERIIRQKDEEIEMLKK